MCSRMCWLQITKSMMELSKNAHRMKHNKTILVVEDEPLLMEVLKGKLTHEGFSILGARNGQEGLGVALKEYPDMILLDIIMPVMDGMTMLKKLREDTWGKKAKVIILTNLSSSKKTREAMENNTYEYLIKADWTLEDIVIKIREVLSQ